MKHNIFLTEQLLIEFLLEYIDSSGICNRNFLEYNFRPDFVSHGKCLVVEFDGYLHYTKSATIINDCRKDHIINSAGYKCVRIPYFIQLNKSIMKQLFGEWILEPFDFNVYPHGFIDKKAVLPADFCSLGVNRFYRDIEYFETARVDILKSIEEQIKILGDIDFVLPTKKGAAEAAP